MPLLNHLMKRKNHLMKKMMDLDIWQEYSIYLTRKIAEDQGKGSHEGSPLSRASGTAVRSWMKEMKTRTEETGKNRRRKKESTKKTARNRQPR